VNGIRVNGIRVNGLDPAALADPEFADWFNEADDGDTELHSNFMSYVAACALSAQQSTSFTDANSVEHVWPGSLGLAPAWLEGPISAEEEGWISACLLAHVNSNNKSVQVSVRGAHSGLATTPAEVFTLTTYGGAFFGDLFNEEGPYYACSTPVMRDSSELTTSEYQTVMRDQGRECPIDGCDGTYEVMDCATHCTPATPPFTSCSYGGATWDQVVNLYTPKYKRAGLWIRTGVTLDTSCSNCMEQQALNFWNNGSGTTGNARASSWTSAAGEYALEVRYANGSAGPLSLKVQVNGATVMNGASQYWDFETTGGWDSWALRTIPVTLPASNIITLVGGGGANPGPKVDLAWVRFP
jgi:hypothetical protein